MPSEQTPRLTARPWARIAERIERPSESSASLRVVLVVIASALLAGAMMYAIVAAGPWDHGSLAVALTLVALGALAEAMPYDGEGKGTAGSVSFIPYTAALLVNPEARTLAAIALVQGAMQAFHRRGVIKGVFNVAQFVLSLGSALLIVRTAGGGDGWLSDWSFVHSAVRVGGPAVMGLACSILVNKSLMAVVLNAATRAPLAKSLATSLRSAGPLFAMQIVFGVYLAWLAANLGLAGALGMALPILAVRQLSRSTIQLTRVTEELLDLMVAAIEARDPYTSGHSKRVAAAATKIAKAIGLRPEEVERVQVAALLHDVGKINEEFARILAKEGRLTAEEWEIMKRHPIRSAELVGLVSSLRDVVPAVRHHHENWDGTGYPDGRRGVEIPLASRIIMFADTLDAITTDRPYRRALDPDEARKEFIKFRGRQFDPAICDTVVSAAVWDELYRAALNSQKADKIPATSSVA